MTDASPVSEPIATFDWGIARNVALMDDRIVYYQQTVPLDQITSVRCYIPPTEVGIAFVHRCTIKRRGGRAIGIAASESDKDMLESFQSFVRALVAQMQAKHPDTPLLSGEPPTLFWTYGFLYLCTTIMFGLSTVMLVSEGRYFWAVVMFCLSVFSVLALCTWPANRGKPLDLTEI